MLAYIFGAISGVPDLNRPAFHAGEEKLIRMGWQTYTPFTEPDEEAIQEALRLGREAVGRPAYNRVMRKLLRKALEADALFGIPGWEDSNGAVGEAYAAHLAGTPIFDLATMKAALVVWTPPCAEILSPTEAQARVAAASRH